MRVVTQGRFLPDRAYQSRCRCCGVAFFFTLKEATRTEFPLPGLRILCPTEGCGEAIHVEI